jgi:predicted flap endonuclease-1-like 5' DNA nuclease
MHKTAQYLTALGLGLSVSAMVGWLLLRESKRSKEAPAVIVKSRNRDAEPDALPEIVLPLDELDEAADTAPRSSGDDDLTRIGDIGPRFAAALRTIGITRFAQLAQHTPETLAEQLAPHVTVTPQRIQNKNWIGQAAELAKHVL